MAIALNAALWGRLRDHIDLASLIFAKLPLDAFFRLRLVCKEWNRLASDRAFLLEHFSSLQPPYFVVDTRLSTRLLCRDAGWTWAPLPPMKCESSGLLMEDSDDEVRVFDLHTRMVHALPDVLGEHGLPLTEEEREDYEEGLVGMIVDTNVKPHAFRVVLADNSISTGIYDSTSGLWTLKESIYEDLLLRITPGRAVSAFSNGILSIRNGILYFLHCYDVRRDEWSVQMFPKDVGWVFADFGVLEDRLYVVGLNLVRPRRILVWELVKQTEGFPDLVDVVADEVYRGDDDGPTWRAFDVMPDDLWLWMFAGNEEKLEHHGGVLSFVMKSRFCGEFVLVYNLVDCEDFTGERAVLYNLKSRKWEKVDLPDSVV